MELLRGYWKQRGFLLLLLGGWAVVFAVVFALYDLPGEAVGYAVLLGSAGTALPGWTSSCGGAGGGP